MGRRRGRGGCFVSPHFRPCLYIHLLKRVGARGEGKWERVSWEQTLDEVAAKLSRLRDMHGPETLAFTHGTSRTHHWDCRRFFNLFASPNVCGVNNVCMCPSCATNCLNLLVISWKICRT